MVVGLQSCDNIHDDLVQSCGALCNPLSLVGAEHHTGAVVTGSIEALLGKTTPSDRPASSRWRVAV